MSRRRFRAAWEQAYEEKSVDLHAQNTIRTDFYRTTLWRLYLGSVDDSVPDNWSIDYFRFALYYGGSVAVTEYKDVIVPFMYSIVTRNDWDYPVKIQSVGKAQIGERTVGLDCEIIYLGTAFNSLWSPLGIAETINIFAQRLANCDAGIDINLLNTRTPFIFGARDKSDEMSLRKLYTKMMDGEPAIFYRFTDQSIDGRTLSLPAIQTPVKNNYIAGDVQEAKLAIYNEFLTLIGVKSANTLKKERMITDEVNSVDGQLDSAVSLWQRNVDRCIGKVRNMFGDKVDNLNVQFKGVNQ